MMREPCCDVADTWGASAGAVAQPAPDILDRMATKVPATSVTVSPGSARGEAATWFGRGVGAAAGALFVAVIALGFLAAGRALLLVFIALLLGAALEPLVARLRGRLPIARGPAILAVYLAFFSIAGAVVVLVVPGTLAQTGDLVSGIPAALNRAEVWGRSLGPEPLSASALSLVGMARAALAPGGTPAPGEILAAGLTVADAVISVITVLALVFFWMTERARLQRFTLSFLPGHRRAGVRDAWNDIEVRLGAWVRGQLILMGAIAVMTGTACLVLGLPSPLLLGMLAGLAELIPMVGPAIGAIPALLVAATLRPEVLPLVLGAYLLIHFVEGNILVPRVMGNAAGISSFLVIASLLVGGAIDGLRGALIAIPIAAAIEVILERLQDRDEPVTPTPDAGAALGADQDAAQREDAAHREGAEHEPTGAAA
jgi:predicted PurR-regulated permease PerM